MKSKAIFTFAAVIVACSAHGNTYGDYGAHATCDGLHDDCSGGGLCCPGMQCGWGSCCVSAGEGCAHDGECCSNHCQDGVCTPSPAGEACGSGAQCAPGMECDFEISTCKVMPGGHCKNGDDCVDLRCDAGTCACGEQYDLCVSDGDCCEGMRCVQTGYCDVGP